MDSLTNTSNVNIGDPYKESKENQMVENLSSFICRTYGNEMIDYYNNFILPKKQGKKFIVEEYARMLDEDSHFKILAACINQRTLKKIHFWILFWSIFSILSVIGGMIILIKTGVLVDLL